MVLQLSKYIGNPNQGQERKKFPPPTYTVKPKPEPEAPVNTRTGNDNVMSQVPEKMGSPKGVVVEVM